MTSAHDPQGIKLMKQAFVSIFSKMFAVLEKEWRGGDVSQIMESVVEHFSQTVVVRRRSQFMDNP